MENGDSIFSAQLDKLNALGESVVRTDLVSGETNIIRTNDGWSGAADPRREGLAIRKLKKSPPRTFLIRIYQYPKYC